MRLGNPLAEFIKTRPMNSTLSRFMNLKSRHCGYPLTESYIEAKCLNNSVLTSKLHNEGLCFNANKKGLESPVITQNCASGATRPPDRLLKTKNPQKSLSSEGFHLITVVWEGILYFHK